MKKLFKKVMTLSKQSASKGFTLVELLIVIAIIGILAVAVLIALDPIEQTSRAQDVKLITASGEIKGAIDRYYSSKLMYPWCTTTTCTSLVAGCAASTPTAFATAGTCGATVLAALQSSGELKSTLTPDVKVVLNIAPAVASAYTSYMIAYNPYSKSERTKYPNPAVIGNPGVYTTGACTAVCTAAATAATCGNGSTTSHYCVF